MAHTFIVKFSDEISSVVEKVHSGITGSGGRFEGDTEGGLFEGKTVAGLIRGRYRFVAGDEIEVTITHKPFIVPYGSIEAEIKKFFA